MTANVNHASLVRKKTDAFARLFPERRFTSFMYRQDRFLFFSIVNELVRPDTVVLDFGAGRNVFPQFGPHLSMIATYRGRCARIIGVDVDPVVKTNDALDEAHVIGMDGKLPFADESIDLIYSYAVFEHIANPDDAIRELHRVLKPGGWICAWTPNKWGYVGIGARLIPNRLHAKLLRAVEPGGREAHDVFPTCYRINTLSEIKKHIPADKFDNFSFGYNAQPSYNFGKAWIARFWLLYMALTPRFMAQSLFIMARKKLNSA